MNHGAGMMSADQMDALTALSGTEFDRQWLTRMIEHHEGAIDMANTELADGENRSQADGHRHRDRPAEGDRRHAGRARLTGMTKRRVIRGLRGLFGAYVSYRLVKGSRAISRAFLTATAT